MIKVFISQPMKGKSNKEIEEERSKIVKTLNEGYGQDKYEVIDSFFKDAPVNANPLWFLGKSIELLSTADVVFFAHGWQEARGCRIEHECCEQYGIDIKYC